MATTGTVKGNLIGVYIEDADGSGDTNYDLIACATNASLSVSNDIIETVCKDNDGARTILPGQQSVTINVEGLTAYDNVGREHLFAAVKDKTELTIQYGTGVTGDPFVRVGAFITSFEESAPLNDSASYSVTFEASTVMTTGTFS